MVRQLTAQERASGFDSIIEVRPADPSVGRGAVQVISSGQIISRIEFERRQRGQRKFQGEKFVFLTATPQVQRKIRRREEVKEARELAQIRQRIAARQPGLSKSEIARQLRISQRKERARQFETLSLAQQRAVNIFIQQGKKVDFQNGKIILRDGKRKTVITPRAIAKVPISATVSARELERFRVRSIIRARKKAREEEGIKLQAQIKELERTKGFTIAGAIGTVPKKQIPKTPSELKRLAEKKLVEFREKAEELQTMEIKEIEFRRKQKVLGKGEELFRGTVVLGLIGARRGVIGSLQTVVSPVKFVRSQFQALRPKNFKATIRGIEQEFSIDPVGTVVEYTVFAKTLNLLGKLVKRSPVGRFVQEELYITSQPKTIRPFVRAIIKSSKVQEKINPTKIKSLKGVNFAEIKSLTKIEARAVAKTLRQTDSVVFGSAASRTLSKNRTPLPKDVDIATRNIATFNRQFVNNLPKNSRGNYGLKGQKIIRKSTRQAIMDVKPIERLIPQRNLLGRGNIPVVGYVKKVTRVKGKVLPRLKRKPVTGKLQVPTQKIVTVKGIKLTGFGEQTVRKGLGTLQVLIEKNVKRAKDPQSFLIGLKVQLQSLKRTKPKTPIGRIRLKGKIKTLSNSIKILQSKDFIRILEKKVPGITKEFPLLKRISTNKLKRINIKKVNRIVKARLKKVVPLNNKLKNLEKKLKTLNKKTKTQKVKRDILKVKSKINIVRKQIKKITGVTPSKLPPSKLTSKLRPSRIKPSRLKPSKIPSRLKPSKVPSKLPTTRLPSQLRVLSRIPSIIPTFIPISRLPSRLPSRIPSRLPSKLKLSRLPKTRPSRLIGFALPKLPKKKVIIDERKKKKKLKRLAGRVIQKQTFIFLADLYSRIYGIVANPKEKRAFLKLGRAFTGFERRKIIKGKR